MGKSSINGPSIPWLLNNQRVFHGQMDALFPGWWSIFHPIATVWGLRPSSLHRWSTWQTATPLWPWRRVPDLSISRGNREDAPRISLVDSNHPRKLKKSTITILVGFYVSIFLGVTTVYTMSKQVLEGWVGLGCCVLGDVNPCQATYPVQTCAILAGWSLWESNWWPFWWDARGFLEWFLPQCKHGRGDLKWDTTSLKNYPSMSN